MDWAVLLGGGGTRVGRRPPVAAEICVIAFAVFVVCGVGGGVEAGGANAVPGAFSCFTNASTYDPLRFTLYVSNALYAVAHTSGGAAASVAIGYNRVVVQVIGRTSTPPGATLPPWTPSPPLPPAGAPVAPYTWVKLRFYIVDRHADDTQLAMSIIAANPARFSAALACAPLEVAPRFVTDDDDFENVDSFNPGFRLLVYGSAAIVATAIIAGVAKKTGCLDCLRTNKTVRAVAEQTGLARLYRVAAGSSARRKRANTVGGSESDDSDEELLTVPVVAAAAAAAAALSTRRSESMAGSGGILPFVSGRSGSARASDAMASSTQQRRGEDLL